MRVLEHLEPRSVLHFFEDICAIPHGSGNTKAISDYCVRFARERGLRWYQDEMNNVVIYQDGTAGYEASAPVILQGHLDMVAEKAPDSDFDFTRDGLRLRVDGDFISADGTTLGADDGIAVAMMLAVLDDASLAHPPLEALFTVDEETGMYGAHALDFSLLRGRRMLNLDSEDEGVFTAGCAGGAKASFSLPLTEEAAEGVLAELRVSGLRGGHSGEEIDKGRANAAIVLGRALHALRGAGARLVSARSGNKDNAIAPDAQALVALEEGSLPRAQSLITALDAALQAEYAQCDPELRLGLTACGQAQTALSEASAEKVTQFLLLTPNGVAEMSAAFPGLVQTSSNLGIFRVEHGAMRAVVSVRSVFASQKELLLARLEALAAALGAQIELSGAYPAWEYRQDSQLRETAVRVYEAQTGKKPVVKLIHGGLECGLFSAGLPGLDCVSFGPDLQDIHTPRERMSVSSAERTWKLLCAILRELK